MSGPPGPIGAPLSPRQREALEWAARGKTVSETAMIMGVSHTSARVHGDIARHKLNAVNICHAVAKAVAAGLVTL